MSQQIKHLNEDNVRTILKWINLSASIDKSINDLAIGSDIVWSSKKISEQAIELKHELEQYIQSSINGLTHLEKKIVDTLPSDADAEENILYLVKDTSVVDDVVYNQYLLIDGKLESLGDTSTDLSNVYLKDEADAKFALVSNLQTLIDMVGDTSDLETTAKDTLVNAINEIKEGLAEKQEFLSIAPSSTNTSTDYRLDITHTDGTVTKTDNLRGADGVMLDNVGYYGFRVVDGRLKLYVNVTDDTATDVDNQAPPFSLVEKSGVKHLVYTVGGIIKYESKTII